MRASDAFVHELADDRHAQLQACPSESGRPRSARSGARRTRRARPRRRRRTSSRARNDETRMMASVGHGMLSPSCANSGANFGITKIVSTADRERRSRTSRSIGIAQRRLDAVLHVLVLLHVLGEAVERRLQRAGLFADADDADVQRRKDRRMAREARRRDRGRLPGSRRMSSSVLAQHGVVGRGGEALASRAAAECRTS